MKSSRSSTLIVKVARVVVVVSVAVAVVILVVLGLSYVIWAVVLLVLHFHNLVKLKLCALLWEIAPFTYAYAH